MGDWFSKATDLLFERRRWLPPLSPEGQWAMACPPTAPCDLNEGVGPPKTKSNFRALGNGKEGLYIDTHITPKWYSWGLHNLGTENVFEGSHFDSYTFLTCFHTIFFVKMCCVLKKWTMVSKELRSIYSGWFRGCGVFILFWMGYDLGEFEFRS